MKVLSEQEITQVSAGSLSEYHFELNKEQMQYLRTRSLVGLLSGSILGLNLTPEYFLLSSLIGFSCGFSIGLAESWIWS